MGIPAIQQQDILRNTVGIKLNSQGNSKGTELTILALCCRHKNSGNGTQTHSDHAALHGVIDEYSSARVPELLDVDYLNVLKLLQAAIWGP